MDWSAAAAPSLDDFLRLARAAFAALPEPIRAACGEVLIRVEDFAPQDLLRDMEIEDPFELTGLYQGVDLTQKSNWDSTGEPDMVFLYRRPILDEWCEHGGVSLGELISHVLVHEIGHHFGFSDDDIHAIEDAGE